MAYNATNKNKQISYILQVYRSVKHYDVPDTFIVRHVFPKHNIFISYRTWTNIKNGKQTAVNKQQLALF